MLDILQTLINIIISVLLFLFGASLGSFVLVVAERYGVKSFIRSRSVCMSCNKVLSWKELVPVFSFLYLRGKCLDCKSNIKINLFLIELLSGLIFLLLPFTLSLYYFNNLEYILSLLLFIFVFIFSLFIFIYDIKHKIVNLESLIILSVLSVLSQIGIQWFDNYQGINYWYLLSPLFTSGLFLFLYLISRGRWIGFGDILLFIVFGLMLPLPMAISGMFYSIWIGAIVSLTLLLFNHKTHLKSQLPFAPFIIIGFLYSFMVNSDILSLNMLF